MIQIRYLKEHNRITSLTIEGHACYQVHGKDIVCAAVSAMVITTVNAILRIETDTIFYEEHDGYVKIEVKQHTEVTDELLENLFALLKELEKQYPNYIKFKR